MRHITNGESFVDFAPPLCEWELISHRLYKAGESMVKLSVARNTWMLKVPQAANYVEAA
jgi:hypothetical protein